MWLRACATDGSPCEVEFGLSGDQPQRVLRTATKFLCARTGRKRGSSHVDIQPKSSKLNVWTTTYKLAAVKIAQAISALHDDMHRVGCRQSEEPKRDNAHEFNAECTPLISSSQAKLSPLPRQPPCTRIALPTYFFFTCSLFVCSASSPHSPHRPCCSPFPSAGSPHWQEHLLPRLSVRFSHGSRIITGI